MLDLQTPMVITVFDQGRLTWRRSNGDQPAGALTTREKNCWRVAGETGEAVQAPGLPRIDCWAIHEPEWKREIMRSEIDPWSECE